MKSCPSPENVSYHRVPANQERAVMWMRALDMDTDRSTPDMRICGRHFDSSCFKDTGKRIQSGELVKMLKVTAIPTLYLQSAGPEVEVAVGFEREDIPANTETEDEVIHTASIQTQTFLGKCCEESEKKYRDALKKITDLEKKIEKCQKLTKQRQKEIVKEYLSDLGHSELSIKNIMSPDKFHRHYNQDDICNSLILKSMSNRCYNYLRKNKILPLPSSTTLSKWLVSVDCAPGFQNFFFEMLHRKFQDAEVWERQAILSFDELDLKKSFEYDRLNKQVYGNHKKMQTVMIRGLLGKWKQVIFFDFDQRMTKDLLCKIVVKCEDVGLKIRGVSFDLGNPTFLSEFGILKNLDCSFINPADSSRLIYFFPDVPHLLKRLRDHILDKGVHIRSENGMSSELRKSDFQNMIDSDGDEFKVCLKLTNEVINVTGQARQRVLPAAQLLSFTVGKAMLYHFGPSYMPQSETIICINNWFDAMNSRLPYSKNDESCGFGLNEKTQLGALDKMESFVQNMEFCNKGAKYSRSGKLSIPFQRGILVSIKSTRALYGELKEDGYRYFLTSKVNSDCLENFFSRVRSIGGDNDHPGPASAVTRIRILLMGKDPQHLVSKPSVLHNSMEDAIVHEAAAAAPVPEDEDFVSQELTKKISQHPTVFGNDQNTGIHDEKKVKMTGAEEEKVIGWGKFTVKFNIHNIFLNEYLLFLYEDPTSDQVFLTVRFNNHNIFF